MAVRKLQGVSEYSIQDILKVVIKGTPEISTYGAASHLKLLHGVMPNQPATLEHQISVTLRNIQEQKGQGSTEGRFLRLGRTY